MNSDSIPIDLIIAILSRLPAKSIARFHCVSKLWASTLRRPYFTELFLTKSSAQPRILFAIEEDGVWSFFSSPQRQNPYEKSSSSLVVAAEFHIKFPPYNMKIDPEWSLKNRRFACGYASGLIYFYGMRIKEEDNDGVPVICNPNTGQYATLPYLDRYKISDSFFGYDPIDKQYKVLFMAYPGCSDDHKILTLGTGKMLWRTIKCPLPHYPWSEGICINGVLYYIGRHTGYVRSDVVDETSKYVVVCFDVRSEKFKFINLQSFCKLVDYNGKLCVIYFDDDGVCWMDIKLHVWVLEDVERQEWSKYVHTLRDNKYGSAIVVGVTTTGEIIFSMGDYTSKKPFYVSYFNPEKNTLQRVEIQGFGEYLGGFKKYSVYTFVDHVEDLNVNDSKILNSSIYVPYVKPEEEEYKKEKEKEKEEEKGEEEEKEDEEEE